MGTSQQQKAQSRAAIVAAASRLFRAHGVEAVSVAQIMDAAGLTHGGFPRHFASKQDLVKEALGAAADGQDGGGGTPDERFDAFARAYLTPEHRDHPETGCVYAALGSEIARTPAETRQILGDRIRDQIDAFGPDPATRAAGLARWSTLIGALILARLADPDVSDDILAAARKSVGVTGPDTGPERHAAG